MLTRPDPDAPSGSRPLYADGHLTVEQMPPPTELRFTGVIDARNALAVTTSVVAAHHAGADLHLDLSAAEFHDASGLDALLVAAGRLRSGRLVLYGLPPLLQTAMQAVAAGRSRRLAIDAGGPRAG